MTLKEWMKENRYTQTLFASMMNPPPPLGQLSGWVNGNATPRLARILEIQAITKGRVKPADWLSNKESADA